MYQKKLLKRKSFIQNKFVIIFFIAFFRLILDYIYEYIVSPLYSYAGLTVDFSIDRYFVSWVVLFLYVSLFLSLLNIDSCGAYIISILILCSAIPSTMIISFFEVDTNYIILNILYWTILVLTYKIGKNIKGFKIKLFNSTILLYLVFLLFGGVILFICLFYTGFNISFDLYNVYETRAEFNSFGLPALLTYIFSASIIAFPIIFVYAISKKKKWIAFLAVVFQILAYSADGRKSTLFVLIATILSYYFLKRIKSSYFPVLFAAIGSVGTLEKIFLNSVNVIDLLFRRLFIIPAYLSFSYYDFFSQSEKDYFRQGVFGRLGFESPYSESIPYIIGNRYYLGSYANNGLFADAYSNLGNFGVIVLPMLIVVALILLDQCSQGLDSKTCIGIIFVSAYTFLSSSFFVVMLTHGFLIGCLLISFIPREPNHVK